VTVYPSISTGIVNVEASKNKVREIKQIQVLQTDGTLVREYGQSFNKVVLDLTDQREGLYLIKVIYNGNKSKTFSVIYKKDS